MKVFQSLFGTQGAGPVADALATADIMVTAGPWQQVATLAIGGLTAVGFDRAQDIMLVTSSNGQSVIDATTGAILYRNRDGDGLDIPALKGTRQDHPADERFDMVGLYGGGLRTMTNDGWYVDRVAGHCILQLPDASIDFLHAKWAESVVTRHFTCSTEAAMTSAPWAFHGQDARWSMRPPIP